MKMVVSRPKARMVTKLSWTPVDRLKSYVDLELWA